MKQAWFVRPKLDDANMIEWFRAHQLVATKVSGNNFDKGRESSVDLKGKTIEEINEILAQDPYRLTGNELGNTRLFLDIFVNQMEVGDLGMSSRMSYV